MIELSSDKYYLVREPLRNVAINHYFARSVVERHVDGNIFVDNLLHPQTFYIIHPYKISLLFGNGNNYAFNNKFLEYALNLNKTRTYFEWLQTPRDWDQVLSNLFGDKLIKVSDNPQGIESGIIELHTRVNFRFNKEKYLQYKGGKTHHPYKVVKTDATGFEEMNGSVIPKLFWNNARDFLSRGVGFSVKIDGKIASTAYSAFVHDQILEIGIETVPEFRGKGYAEIACSHFIDYCIERNIEPVWSCRYENQPSYRLAQKLGFEPTLMFPFYRLSK